MRGENLSAKTTIFDIYGHAITDAALRKLDGRSDCIAAGEAEVLRWKKRARSFSRMMCWKICF